MRWRSSPLSALGFLLALAGCASERPAAGAPDLVGVQAVVRRFPIDSDTWVLVLEDSLGTRLLPDRLPPAFRQDGLRVVVSGRRLEIPPDVRMVAPPLALTAIQAADGGRTY